MSTQIANCKGHIAADAYDLAVVLGDKYESLESDYQNRHFLQWIYTAGNGEKFYISGWNSTRDIEYSNYYNYSKWSIRPVIKKDGESTSAAEAEIQKLLDGVAMF